MRTFHLALLVVASVAGCDASVTASDHRDLVDLIDPSDCEADLPQVVVWDGKLPLPLPPPQSAEATVQIYDSPEDPKSLWAFSTDAGKITGWIVLSTSDVGSLVQHTQRPVQQLAGLESFTAKTSVVKVRPPKGPRLSAFILSAAVRELAVTQAAEDDAKGCPEDAK